MVQNRGERGRLPGRDALRAPPDCSSPELRQEGPSVRRWLSEVKHAGCWYGIPAFVAALLSYPLYWAGCSIARCISADHSQDGHQYWENGQGD